MMIRWPIRGNPSFGPTGCPGDGVDGDLFEGLVRHAASAMVAVF
jgi:hypothetical protein